MGKKQGPHPNALPLLYIYIFPVSALAHNNTSSFAGRLPRLLEPSTLTLQPSHLPPAKMVLEIAGRKVGSIGFGLLGTPVLQRTPPTLNGTP